MPLISPACAVFLAVIAAYSKPLWTLFYVTVEAEFDFVSSEDGSAHVVRTFGEAMDSGDKATNKAMSAAYRRQGRDDCDGICPRG